MDTNVLTKVPNIDPTFLEAVSKDRWSREFREHGELWGKEPSPTGEMLIKQVQAVAERLKHLPRDCRRIKVAEVGFGYGRDIHALLKAKMPGGAQVYAYGIDSSPVGHILADHKFSHEKRKPFLMTGDFTSSSLPFAQGDFDFVVSHRVMHLLGTNGKIKAFLENARDLLKDNGTAIISVRNEHDFKPDRMTRKDDGTVFYNDRPDHIITLWTTKDLVDKFQRHGLTVQDAIQSQEDESILHPGEKTSFTIIRATKIPAPSNDL